MTETTYHHQMQSAAHGREPVRPAEGETCTPMAAVGCMEGFLPARAPKPVGIPHGGTWSAHGRFWRVLSTPIRGRGATARPIAAVRWRGWSGCSIAVSGKTRQRVHDARAIWSGNSGGSLDGWRLSAHVLRARDASRLRLGIGVNRHARILRRLPQSGNGGCTPMLKSVHWNTRARVGASFQVAVRALISMDHPRARGREGVGRRCSNLSIGSLLPA